VIKALGLERCRDTIIGDHMRRGVSGVPARPPACLPASPERLPAACLRAVLDLVSIPVCSRWRALLPPLATTHALCTSLSHMPGFLFCVHRFLPQAASASVCL
jgi:hypothetical protein